MFIKLSFTANTRISTPFRMLADIINTGSITSVSALQARFTSGSYSATLTANFDAANSNIIRTTSPTNTSAHIYSFEGGNSYGTYGDFGFTLKQPVYDAASSFIYTQVKTGHTAQNLYMDVGTLITGGTMTSTQLPLTIAETDTNGWSVQGTVLTLGGNNYGQIYPCLTTSNGWDNTRTFWAYITDKCFFWSVTNGTSYPVGWGTTYADPTKQGGPFFQTQYTRYDYHNTDNNGIFPALYTNQRSGVGVGYGTSSDLTSVQNLNYTTYNYVLPLRVNSMVSALPQVGSAWPKLYNQAVHITMATRSSANTGLNQIQVAGTATSATAATYAGGISTAASTRYPNATLTGTGFGLIPFGWEANYYGNHGGNATDQCGVYIFNGDYVPGDTFTYNNTVYMVWPMYNGYSQRVGFAVPMV